MTFRNRYFFASDLLLLILAAYLSFVLRLDSFDLGRYWNSFAFFATLSIVITPLIFWASGLYSRVWRYASVNEMARLAGAAASAALLVGVLTVLGSSAFGELYSIPRSVPFIFLLLTGLATATPRLIMRAWPQLGRRGRAQSQSVPVLIMGAGDAGALIIRELLNNHRTDMQAVGFLDDDLRKHHTHIHGAPVLGNRYDIPRLVKERNIQRVIIAMPTAAGISIREIVRLCEQAKVETRIIPSIAEIVDGTVHVSQLREVNIEDLLRREPIEINADAVRSLMSGKRVLVTGGGGSIGSELCRQIASFTPSQLVLIGHGENSIFDIEKELQSRFPELEVEVIIADIRDRERLRRIYHSYRPEIIFHAAAHKHVPLMEANPSEAITNNVLGTRNLVELAASFNVSHFVLISSDKAVNPTSVMGASKRCAELIVHEVALASGRPYVAVRFGNVLGSRGSVIPYFKKQINAGGPITITHPEMRRFFMTIPEAVVLVLQAATLGKGSEVFVLDMGEPVRIQDLARDLVELSGLRPDEDIEIVYSGIRPGEKLFEELFIEGESYERTSHQKVFVVQSATRAKSNRSTAGAIEHLIQTALKSDDAAIRPLLRQIVSEYDPTAWQTGNGKKTGVEKVAMKTL